MFQGQQYQPNTKFQFVNYEQSSSQSFKDQKKSKSQIPYMTKFQLDRPKSQPSPNPQNVPKSSMSTVQRRPSPSNSVPPEQQHIFVASGVTSSQSKSRKASYTLTTKNQKVALLDYMIQKKLYSSKSKLDTWSDIVKIYNESHNLDAKEGLTVQHARVKYNQILALARQKQQNSKDLTEDEILSVRYDDAKQDYKHDHNRHVKIDKKFENRNPKSTKIYATINKLQDKINDLKTQVSQMGAVSDKYKSPLWLLQKRTTDLKTIEEQYQILEQVDYSTDGTRVKVSKEMRLEIKSKLKLLQDDIEYIGVEIENDLKIQHPDDETDVVVDTELLDKK